MADDEKTPEQSDETTEGQDAPVEEAPEAQVESTEAESAGP